MTRKYLKYLVSRWVANQCSESDLEKALQALKRPHVIPVVKSLEPLFHAYPVLTHGGPK